MTTLIVLVTGVSAAGKTSIARQLKEWGHVAVSLDGYDGLCTWADMGGNEVTRPEHPDLAFLQTHQWIWRPEVLDRLIGQVSAIGVNTVWLTGIAANLPQLRDRFGWTILLRIDEHTMRTRLETAQRGNDFGRVGDSLQHLADTMTAQQELLESLCDTTIDATATIQQVAENVLGETALGWLTRSRGATS